MSARYAVYYVPEAGSPLEVLGSALLGRNAAGDDVPRLRVNLPGDMRLENITVAPRHYGLHATLKAPFALAPGRTADELREAVSDLAAGHNALLLPPLEVGTVPGGSGEQGDFLALRPENFSIGLQELAACCVRELDGFRAPLSAEDTARRTGLSPRQREHMHRWGYPHVLDDFHFHITLTDAIPDAARRCGLAEALRAVFGEVCAPGRVLMGGLALVRQSSRSQPFKLVGTFPLKPLD